MEIQIIQDSCTLCSHCLSVCPAGAIRHSGLDPLRIKRIGKALVSPEAYETVVRGKRSIRHYKDRPVPGSWPCTSNMEKTSDGLWVSLKTGWYMPPWSWDIRPMDIPALHRGTPLTLNG